MIRLIGLAVAAVLIAGPGHAQQSAAVLTPAAGNPNLAVASVKMENGVRVSKLIGAAVYGDNNTQLGSIDDLLMTPDNHVVLAIVSVGGVMGLGGKLVAVPVEQLQHTADGKLMVPSATKDSLNAMPNFVYNG